MLGARGYCDNNPIGQLWRDARITRLFEGPSETLAAFIGQRVLEQPSTVIAYLDQTAHGEITRACILEWTAEEVSVRSEEHTSELQSLMRISYAVSCLKKKKK